MELTHVDEKGVKMVEIGHKDVVFRKATVSYTHLTLPTKRIV